MDDRGSSGVPENWEVKSLGEISDISSGSTPSRSKLEYWNGNIPWVTTGEISYNTITETSQHITELGFKASSLKMYQPGTILMAMYGQGVTRGRIARLAIPATINQACCAITIKTDTDPEFIYSQLGHLYSHIRTLGHGGNQQNLNGEIIKQIALKLPPLEEQRKIADILSVWDEAIEQQTRLIELKRERKRGLMQQLLTGKVRFKEFEGLEWDNTTLSLHASKRKGKNVELNNERKGLPYIGSVAFSGWYSQYTCDANAETCNPNDVLLLWDGEYAGKSTTGHRGAVGSTVMALKLKTTLNNWFLHNLLTFDNYKVRAVREGSGIPHMPGDFTSWYEIKLPPVAEQQKIATVLSAADTELETLQTQLTALRTQKRGLMQQLLTGKTRVKLDDPVTAQ